MALDDDCLYEVFKRLHFLDLSSVAKVCIRFEKGARAAFPSNYKMLHLNREECDQDQMENILCQFGSFIHSIHIASNHNASDGILFRSIIQNCTSTLIELRLFKFNIQVDSPNFRLPFLKLETLCLTECVGNVSMAHLIDECPELRLIYMSSGELEGVNGLINRQFKKLECLYLSNYAGQIYNYTLENFIVSNPTLRILSIYKFSRLLTSNVIRLIGENMLELCVLELNLSIDYPKQSDFECIANLRSLEKLQLYLNRMKAAPLANALASNNLPIQHLSIRNGIIDANAIKYVSLLKQIEILDMYNVDGFTYENAVNLVKNLPELKSVHWRNIVVANADDQLIIIGLMKMLDFAKNLYHLSLEFLIDNDFDSTYLLIINTNDYEAMLNIVRNRPEKIRLHILIFGIDIKLNVADAILQENRNILFIEDGSNFCDCDCP